MTIEDAVLWIDRIKPNNFENDDMVRWLDEVEGRIQTEILLLDINECFHYTSWSDDKDKELIVPSPYDRVYTAYLSAMVDNANGEYNRYMNTKLQYDDAFSDLSRWIAQTYAPGNGRHTKPRMWRRRTRAL